MQSSDRISWKPRATRRRPWEMFMICTLAPCVWWVKFAVRTRGLHGAGEQATAQPCLKLPVLDVNVQFALSECERSRSCFGWRCKLSSARLLCNMRSGLGNFQDMFDQFFGRHRANASRKRSTQWKDLSRKNLLLKISRQGFFPCGKF